mmetsp:Transcript_48063/g.54460  ORF Transcript_48063/g.54460 Transcript_48063/m.54460 type:complete len:455 (+) Transcript_48063:223-1587(+)
MEKKSTNSTRSMRTMEKNSNSSVRSSRSMGSRRSSSKSVLSPEDKQVIKEGKKLNKLAKKLSQRALKVYDDDDDDDVRDNHNNNNNNNSTNQKIVHSMTKTTIHLPTPVQLSQELCRIVDLERYSLVESMRTLELLFDWAQTHDAQYLQYFHRYAGVVKVLDFLQQTLHDATCQGPSRMECIGKAALVIQAVCSVSAATVVVVDDSTICSTSNEEEEPIASQIAETLIECGGIDILIEASQEYTGGDDLSQMYAVQSVLAALSNIILVKEDVIGKETALAFFNTGVDIIAQLKYVDGPIASKVLEHVFHTLSTIVDNEYMTKQYFQYKKTLSESLHVFLTEDEGTWSNRTERVVDEAIYFFTMCRMKQLLDDDHDYELLLPFLAMSLKECSSNTLIRTNTVKFLFHACNTVNGKKHLEQAGMMESLSLLLSSDNDIPEEEKQAVRKVIAKIVAP